MDSDQILQKARELIASLNGITYADAWRIMERAREVLHHEACVKLEKQSINSEGESNPPHGPGTPP